MYTGSIGNSPLSNMAQRNAQTERSPADDFLQQLHAVQASNPLADSNIEPADDAMPKVAATDPLQAAFRQFVGNTLYGQMLKSMRSTVGEPAYMHGGQTEKIFQQQLDQIMVEDLTEKSGHDC